MGDALSEVGGAMLYVVIVYELEDSEVGLVALEIVENEDSYGVCNLLTRSLQESVVYGEIRTSPDRNWARVL